MLTAEQLDTAAIYGCGEYSALRELGMNGRISNPEHAAKCCAEVANIVSNTTIIDGVAVETDWLVQPEEIEALVSLAFACKELK